MKSLIIFLSLIITFKNILSLYLLDYIYIVFKYLYNSICSIYQMLTNIHRINLQIKFPEQLNLSN